jgi:hypothetical protein
LELSPTFTRGYERKANALFLLERFTEAAEAYRQANAMHCGQAEAYKPNSALLEQRIRSCMLAAEEQKRISEEESTPALAPVQAELEQTAYDGPLAPLRRHPQFTQLKQVIQADPAAMIRVLERIGQQNPELLALIGQNQEEFTNMMNEGASTDANERLPTDTTASTSAVSVEEAKLANGCCLNSHPLQPFVTPNTSFCCDGGCGKENLPVRSIMYGCRICDHDICAGCTPLPYALLVRGLSNLMLEAKGTDDTDVGNGSDGRTSSERQEVQTLVDFRTSTKYPHWESDTHGWDKLHSKMRMAEVESLALPGVTIRDSHVVKIARQGLFGQLPASLGQWTQLERLVLSNNKLSGPIPASVAQLECLQEFEVTRNILSGEIPLPLIRLHTQGGNVGLSGNSGFTLPSNIDDIRAGLTELDFRQVRSIVGPIPSRIGLCDMLKRVNLRGNKLTGSIPSAITQLKLLESLDLGDNRLTGKICEFGQLARLQNLSLDSNHLSGNVPERWPATLKHLKLNSNPDLSGIITKAAILQCDQASYHDCKARWQCTDEEKAKGLWMAGPFIVGATFASEDIRHFLWNRRKLAISDSMLTDPPEKGDESHAMFKTHGTAWCAWQEVWLLGLRSLQTRDVYVMSSERFKEKFATAVTKEECERNCFDPEYELPAGECATSILDWERRQFLQVAQKNGLNIVHLEATPSTAVKGLPSWYC